MKSILILTILVTGISNISAQIPLNLSFKEAVRIALDNNIGLKQERNNLKAIQADRISSYASLAPDIDAIGIAFRNDGNFFLAQTGEVVNTLSDNVYGSLDAGVTLFNGFSKISTIKRETHRFEAQINRINRREQDVIWNVAVQYLTILQDQEQVIIANENHVNQQVLYNQISTMFEIGSIAITDKYDQDFKVKNSELEVIRAENRLINDKALLAEMLMVDPATEFVLVEPGWDIKDISLEDYNMQELYDLALKNRKDLQSAIEDKQAAMQNIKVQKGLYFPTVAGFYSLSSRYSDQTVNRNFQEQFVVDNKAQQYGLRLSIPIFSGYRSRANVINAKMMHQNASLEVDNQEITIKTDVLRAYQNFRDVALAYQVSFVQFQAAQKSQETQNESYNLGISSLIELSQANNILVEAQTSLSRAKYALLFQKILMDYATGTLQFDHLPE